MQCWFRFSGTIALVGLLSSGFPVSPAAFAQEAEKPTPAASPQEPSQPSAADAAADADTFLEGFDPNDLPTPGKHQLRPTPLQIANHRIKRLNERIVSQNARIARLEELLGQQNEKVIAQETTVKELQESVTKADARLQAMFDQIATVSRQVEGIESLQSAQAKRSARAAQQAFRGVPPEYRQNPAEPNVQHTPPGEAAPIPRAIPVNQTQPAAPAPTPEQVVEPPPEGSIVYSVKAGDNLTRIARAHGTSVAEILKFNKITDERKLQIGQELHIPPSAEAATPTPEAPSQ